MIYLLNEWEENRTQDSDFRVAVWDAEVRAIRSIEIGSTRYGGGIQYPAHESLTAEVVAEVRIYLESRFLEELRLAERRAVYEPQSVEICSRVRLLVAHKNQVKVTEPCRGCEGSGKWTNPKNGADRRDCLSCDGTGERETREKLKDEKGKLEWRSFEPGAAGAVIWFGTHRTIHRNGYNKLDRFTGSCRVNLDDGRIMKAPLEKLRLDREPQDGELVLEARRLALAGNCKPLVSDHGGWLTYNWLGDFLAGANQ